MNDLAKNLLLWVVVAGIVTPDAGDVLVGGRPVAGVAEAVEAGWRSSRRATGSQRC